jgi:hypothetical protein
MDNVKQYNFCCNFQGKLGADDTIRNKLVFSGEMTFHLLGQVNPKNLRI